VRHAEVAAAAIISNTKDCIEGCGKYTDIVSIQYSVTAPVETHGSRLEAPPSLITRAEPEKIARWERSFSEKWGQRQREFYASLIEDELEQAQGD
jgi:hypothetical protein